MFQLIGLSCFAYKGPELTVIVLMSGIADNVLTDWAAGNLREVIVDVGCCRSTGALKVVAFCIVLLVWHKVAERLPWFVLLGICGRYTSNGTSAPAKHGSPYQISKELRDS
jgi:hypothetical protein